MKSGGYPSITRMPRLHNQRNSRLSAQEMRANISLGPVISGETDSEAQLKPQNGKIRQIYGVNELSNNPSVVLNVNPHLPVSYFSRDSTKTYQGQHDTSVQKKYTCPSPSETIHALDDEFHHNIASSKTKIQKEVSLGSDHVSHPGIHKRADCEIWLGNEGTNTNQMTNYTLELSSRTNRALGEQSFEGPGENILKHTESENNHGAGHKKVAPRSNNLFRVGPPFSPTKLQRPFFCDKTDEQIIPIMTSRIDRGFELGEAGHWIGYRRNYLTLVSAFTFQDWSFEEFLKHKYFILDEDNGNCKVEVKFFAFAISVKCNSPDVNVGLMQHTPKRDKGPKYVTPIYPAVPGGTLPDHQTVKISSNKKSHKQVANMQRIFNFDREIYYDQHKLDLKSDTTILKEYPGDLLTKVARFERIQFTKSLRVESDVIPSKYFTLSVELLGILDENIEAPRHVVLATSDTAPLLVRGRSASMYPSEKTSGYRATNLDYKI